MAAVSGVGRRPFTAGVKRKLCFVTSAGPGLALPLLTFRLVLGGPCVQEVLASCSGCQDASSFPLCGGGSGATVASCWVKLKKCSLEVAPSHPWVSTLQDTPTASEDPQAHPARTLLAHHQSTGVSLLLTGPEQVKWGRWSLGSLRQPRPPSPCCPQAQT